MVKTLATIYQDYFPFLELATNEQLGEFVRALINQSQGNDVEQMSNIAQALFDTHNLLEERLENAKIIKKKAGEESAKRRAEEKLELERLRLLSNAEQNSTGVQQISSDDELCLTDVELCLTDDERVLNPSPSPIPLPLPKEKREKPTPYPSHEDLNMVLSEYKFSKAAKEAVTDWVNYKHERKESYKPVGFKSLLTQIKNHITEFGESAVFYAMSVSMAGNYQGIVWEKAKVKARGSPKDKPVSEMTAEEFYSGYKFIGE